MKVEEYIIAVNSYFPNQQELLSNLWHELDSPVYTFPDRSEIRPAGVSTSGYIYRFLVQGAEQEISSLAFVYEYHELNNQQLTNFFLTQE